MSARPESDRHESFQVSDCVELRESLYGHRPGSRGVVATTPSYGTVLVRFEATGQAIFVPVGLLRLVA